LVLEQVYSGIYSKISDLLVKESMPKSLVSSFVEYLIRTMAKSY
jgi:hypothetical protein